MNRGKVNISPWLLQGFAAMLVVICLTVAVGISFARYNAGKDADLHFEVGRNASVFLGRLDEKTGNFIREESAWERKDGGQQLHFAVSNGTSATDHVAADQQICLRVIGSPGVWKENSNAKLTLTVDGMKYTAVVSRIVRGSALYAAFGDGWAFSFRNDQGNELTWKLDGGELTCLEMTLSIEGAQILDTGLLQLQVIEITN